MSEPSSAAQHCDGWRRKADEIPQDERMRAMIASSFAALKSMNGVDVRDLEYHQATLRAERDIARKFDNKTALDPSRRFFYGFSECIEATMRSVTNRLKGMEKNQNQTVPSTLDVRRKRAAGEQAQSASGAPQSSAKPAETTATAVIVEKEPTMPTRKANSVVGETQGPVRQEDRANSAPLIGLEKGLDCSVKAVQGEPPKKKIKEEDIDDHMEGHSASDTSHSDVKREEQDDSMPMDGPAYWHQSGMGMQSQMGQRPSGVNGFMDNGAIRTWNSPFDQPRGRLHYRIPRPVMHSTGRTIPMKRDSTRPKFNRETDNAKTLNCPFCHMRDMNIDGLTDHLLSGHNTTPAKSYYAFKCSCGFLGTTPQAARLHKYSCRNCTLTMVKTRKERKSIMYQ